MTTSTEELSRKALALPAGERVRLAQALLATVQKPDAEAEAAWDTEIKRRVAEIDHNCATLSPAEEVFAELHALIR